MAFNVVMLVLGILGASTAITYAWWVKIRVFILRDRLFAIRGDLFDAAAKLGRLDDPAYRQARLYVNSIIRIAATITIPTTAYLIATRKSRESAEFGASADANMQAAIMRARIAVVDQITSYLINWTITGSLLALLVMISRPLIESETRNGVELGLSAKLPDDMLATK